MPIDRTSHITAQKPEKNDGRRSFCSSFAQFLCSNLGLVIVVIAYSIGGAFLFILLEQYIELQDCQEASLQENISISNISESMYNYVTISNDNTTIMYQQIVSYLENFANDVYDRKNNYRYTGQDCLTTSGWTFPSALLFAITVITTIGYGHITPTSWEGQITLICYALIGIPIFLLCLANISSILGDMFRFLYSTFLHCLCCCCRIYARSNHRNNKGKSLNQEELHYVGAISIDPTWPEENHTVNEKRFNDNDEDDIDEQINDIWSRMEGRVPVLVVISIIIAYICLGAIMFNLSEGWTMTIATYFCYITLSTIGFGDYVPGITSSSINSLRFVAACFYIIIGLAILAMCFDLIKESIVDKFAWFAHKFGFIAEDDDQIDDDHTQYANFQYTQRSDISDNRKTQSTSPPPSYDIASADGQWLEDIRDKVEHKRRN